MTHNGRLLRLLLEPVGNPTALQVVYGKLDGHLISRQDLDVVHTHLARNMSQNLVAVFKLYLEHCVRQGFQNGTIKLDDIFLRQQNSLHAK